MKQMLSTLEAIAARRSTTRLVDPAPSRAQLRQILDAAMRAPDHGCCRPWSFIVVPPANAAAFGQLLASAYEHRCREAGLRMDPERRDRERAKALRAPVQVVVVCRPRLDVPVPAHEQLAAVAAATQNLLLAATALGFGSKWSTGAAATDPLVKQALQLETRDNIVGFIYLGTIPDDTRQRSRPPGHPSDPVRFWNPRQNRLPDSVHLS